jgi:hypothetical protein
MIAPTKQKKTTIRRNRKFKLRANVTDSVITSCDAPIHWRLDMREDSNDSGWFARSHRNSNSAKTHRSISKRLDHYISAGGMRSHRRTKADDLATRRQRLAIAIMFFIVAIWLIFRFLPLD